MNNNVRFVSRVYDTIRLVSAKNYIICFVFCINILQDLDSKRVVIGISDNVGQYCFGNKWHCFLHL